MADSFGSLPVAQRKDGTGPRKPVEKVRPFGELYHGEQNEQTDDTGLIM
jgi:hypothetical protein